jgi:hypothetical protein
LLRTFIWFVIFVTGLGFTIHGVELVVEGGEGGGGHKKLLLKAQLHWRISLRMSTGGRADIH